MFVLSHSSTQPATHSPPSTAHSPQCTLRSSLSCFAAAVLCLCWCVYVFFNAHHYHSVCVLNRRSAIESRQLSTAFACSPLTHLLSHSLSLLALSANKGIKAYACCCCCLASFLLLSFCFALSLIFLFYFVRFLCVGYFEWYISLYVCECLCVCIYTPSTNNKRIQQTRNRKFWHFYTWLAATRKPAQ